MRTSVDVDRGVDDYPSRTDRRHRLLPRKDPVAYGVERDGPLSAAHIRRYDSLGFLVFERFFTGAELAPCLEELERLGNDPGIRNRSEAVTDPEGEQLRALFAIHQSDSPMSRLSRHPRVVAIARQLLGSEVYIHQSRLDHEPGYGGRERYWCSDFETWHVEDGMPRMRATSCSVFLTDNHPASAPLLVIPGSHRLFLSCAADRRGRDADRTQAVPDREHLLELANDGGIELITAPAGSVAFLDCNLMHASSSNVTPWPRSNLVTAFNSVENALLTPLGGLEPRPEFIASRRTSPLESP